MDDTDYLALDENVRFRRVVDEGVIVDQRSAEIMHVSGVGIRVLELIRETHSVRGVLAGIVSEFKVPADRARTDLDRFLDTLRAHGVLQAEKADGSG
jgi:hypothetical protein